MKKDNRLKHFFISVIVMFVVITIASVLILAYGITDRCETYMLSETSALVSANASQLKLNINAYLDEIEGNVALMFSDDQSINYDASTTKLDEYDKINVENGIANRIVDLGLLENYSDFCVVYANDNTVGWKSKTTQNMYPDGGMYQDMSAYIKDNKTKDGWMFGVHGNTDRMYYVKRYNDNAIILASFYTRELEKTFEYPDELEGMRVRLIDNLGQIVYSSDQNEVGTIASADVKGYFDKNVAISAITESELVNTGFCENGWMVMCSISKESMMQEFYKLRTFAFAFSVVIIFFAILVLSLLFRRLSKPMDGYVDDLSTKANVDMLSGVLTRRGFEEMVTDILKDNSFKIAAFTMFDVDNFKMVNDTLGHDYGDEIIARMGMLLSKILVSNDKISISVGRLGGDEFAAFIACKEENIKEDVTSLMNDVLSEFNIEFAKEKEKLPLSLSGGVVFTDQLDASYHNMYMAADSALYVSKQSGKDQYNIYEEALTNEN